MLRRVAGADGLPPRAGQRRDDGARERLVLAGLQHVRGQVVGARAAASRCALGRPRRAAPAALSRLSYAFQPALVAESRSGPNRRSRRCARRCATAVGLGRAEAERERGRSAAARRRAAPSARRCRCGALVVGRGRARGSASSWASPSLAVPANPLLTARNGRSARSAAKTGVRVVAVRRVRRRCRCRCETGTG